MNIKQERRNNMYTEMIEVIWNRKDVTLKIAELVYGKPNGFTIGTPLVINGNSRIFEVIITNVVEFKSVSEPFFNDDGEIRKINEFVWESIGSEYIKTAGCVGGGPGPEKAKHIVVFTDSIVFEALCENEPLIRIIEPNYKIKTHKIKLESEYAEILLPVLEKHDVKYLNYKKFNKFNLIIDGKDIDKIFDLLIEEMMSNGIDRSINCLNDYGKNVDTLLGNFKLIKYSI